MLKLTDKQLIEVAGGCDLTCKESTLELLFSCDLETMYFVNTIFKTVLHREELQGADEATIKAALIYAVRNTYF
ncbi:MAG: hypothetical protein JSS07_11595 [Proteobacteria bacterium]|nr:hypothetical protein [Pseudomonadota bacterium]